MTVDRPPVVPLADALRPVGDLDEWGRLECAADRWGGARYVVDRFGKRHWVCAGQRARLSGLRFRARLTAS